MKKLFATLTILFLGIKMFAGVMEVPRKVFVIKTQYFEILFSKESTDTAVLLAEWADKFYLSAKQTFNLEYDFSTLVVISPDSQILSVKYSPSPYNRIVVYEGARIFQQEALKNGLLDLFEHEVIGAVSQSVRNEFWNKTSQIVGGDSLQPVALVNMPFSFLEGAVNTELLKNDTGLLNDYWNLQLLSQMKVENKIPNLLQFTGAMDIYPGETFTKVAGAAFCAYIQQKWGMEKFSELWTLSGKIQLFKFNKKIFEQVYGVSLEEVWLDFVNEIPVPDVIQDDSALFFDYDNDSVYEFLIHTPYGFIWYDKLKKEVDIYDDYSLFTMRQLLFLANDVTALSATPDGQFLIVSYIQEKERKNFSKTVTKIFDLKERRFLKDTETPESLNWIGTGNRFSEASIYSPTVIDKNHLGRLICQKNQWYFEILNFDPNEDFSKNLDSMENSQVKFQVKYRDEILKLKNLRAVNLSKYSLSEDFSKTALFFDFTLHQAPSFTRLGVILLDQNYNPEAAYVMDEDYSGGINDAILFQDKFYYFAHKFNFDEFRFISKDKISWAKAEILFPNIVFPVKNPGISPKITETKDGTVLLSGYQLDKYNPWGLMFHGNWIPLMPVYDITLENELKMIPGLGVTFETQSDPFSNNRIVLSAGALFLPLEYTKFFNASKESEEELAAIRENYSKDIAFCAYAENSSTPVDLSLGGSYRFNLDGEYEFKVIGGAKYEMPLRMTFRHLSINLKALYTASTSYWDPHQIETYPNLADWPLFKSSYRSWQTVMGLEYTNIHQYGISPLKKMGINGGMLLTSTWDLNFKNTKNPEAPKFSPTQVNLGAFMKIEIPQLLPFQNHNGWILSLPGTLDAELFYKNGTALEAKAEFLLAGREIQNGIEKINLYFSRFGFYGGYEIAMDYDTATVVLPDFRKFNRFYEISTSCFLNDSVFTKFLIYATPAIGKFSVDQFIPTIVLQYYIRTQEFKIHFDFKMVFN